MTIHTGDCIEVMAAMEPDSVDAVVTDPPYGLEFMGKGWDKFGAVIEHPDDGEGPWGRTKRVRYGTSISGFQVWCEAWGRAALRVTKPGGYLLAFGGTRTHHRLVCGLEDAGWIIRDELTWVYASGFPKGKANLKPAHEPIVLARKPGPLRPLAIDATRLPTDVRATSQDGSGSSGAYSSENSGPSRKSVLPAHNPSRVLRAWFASRPDADSAPLANALADAFLGHGLLDSLDGYPSCRHCDDGLARISEAVDREDSPLRPDAPDVRLVREWSALRIRENQCVVHPSTWDALALLIESDSAYGNDTSSDPSRSGEASADRRYTDNGGTSLAPLPGPRGDSPQGRWPSNLLLSSPELFDQPNPYVVGSGAVSESTPGERWAREGTDWGMQGHGEPIGYGDSGGYSRFFIVPKADRGDREPVLRPDGHEAGKRFSTHPTMKPTDLMAHLIKLVTPTDGVILDPFLGSGSTAIAAERLGVKWVGIEKEQEYVAIAEARLNGTQRGLGLDVPAPTNNYRPPAKMPPSRRTTEHQPSWFTGPPQNPEDVA